MLKIETLTIKGGERNVGVVLLLLCVVVVTCVSLRNIQAKATLSLTATLPSYWNTHRRLVIHQFVINTVFPFCVTMLMILADHQEQLRGQETSPHPTGTSQMLIGLRPGHKINSFVHLCFKIASERRNASYAR